MDRRFWSRHIEQLDPDRDFQRIYQILVAHEFPWDFNQSLWGALRLRARAVRRMRPRIKPLFAREMANIRSYPGGYEIAHLGTFPGGGCPVVHTDGPVGEHRHNP